METPITPKKKNKKIIFVIVFLLLISLLYFSSSIPIENTPTTPLTIKLHQVINAPELLGKCNEIKDNNANCYNNFNHAIEQRDHLLKQIIEEYIPTGLSKIEAEKLLIDSGFIVHEYQNDSENILVADRVSSHSFISVLCCTFQFRVSVRIQNNHVKEVDIKYYGIGA